MSPSFDSVNRLIVCFQDGPKVKHQGLFLELKKAVCLLEFDEEANELHLRVKPCVFDSLDLGLQDFSIPFFR